MCILETPITFLLIVVYVKITFLFSIIFCYWRRFLTISGENASFSAFLFHVCAKHRKRNFCYKSFDNNHENAKRVLLLDQINCLIKNRCIWKTFWCAKPWGILKIVLLPPTICYRFAFSHLSLPIDLKTIRPLGPNFSDIVIVLYFSFAKIFTDSTLFQKCLKYYLSLVPLISSVLHMGMSKMEKSRNRTSIHLHWKPFWMFPLGPAILESPSRESLRYLGSNICSIFVEMGTRWDYFFVA